MAAVAKCGRKPLDPEDDSVPVNVTLTASMYDRIKARAQRDRVTVQEIVRRDVHDAERDRLK